MKRKVALVLSSGGARGMAHIGVIEELEKLSFEISAVSGSSMGAVVGGIYATGKLNDFTEWAKNLHRLDVYNLMDFSVAGNGFIKGNKVFSEIQKFVPDQLIEELRIPFTAIAGDANNHKEIVFNKGSLYKALRATVAIPGIIVPSYVDGVDLVDGGVVNPLPINHVKRSKGDLLVAVDLNSSTHYHKPKFDQETQNKNEQQYDLLLKKVRERLGIVRNDKDLKSKRLGYYEVLNASLNMMQERLSELILEKHVPDILVKIPKTACKTFEFYKANEMIEAGRYEFLKSYENWKTNISVKT